MATMENINHWRGKLHIARRALAIACREDLPPGTRVQYHHGGELRVVEIVRHHPIGRARCVVRSLVSEQEYDLAYDRIIGIAE